MLQDPQQSIGQGSENFGSGAEAEGECRICVLLAMELHAQQGPIIRVAGTILYALFTSIFASRMPFPRDRISLATSSMPMYDRVACALAMLSLMLTPSGDDMSMMSSKPYRAEV